MGWGGVGWGGFKIYMAKKVRDICMYGEIKETKTYLKSEIDIFDYIISFTDKNPSVGVCSTRSE